MFHSTATEFQISILLGAGWYDAFFESKTWVRIEIWSHLKDDFFSPLPNEKYLGSQVHFWLLFFLSFETDLFFTYWFYPPETFSLLNIQVLYWSIFAPACFN